MDAGRFVLDEQARRGRNVVHLLRQSREPELLHLLHKRVSNKSSADLAEPLVCVARVVELSRTDIGSRQPAVAPRNRAVNSRDRDGLTLMMSTVRASSATRSPRPFPNEHGTLDRNRTRPARVGRSIVGRAHGGAYTGRRGQDLPTLRRYTGRTPFLDRKAEPERTDAGAMRAPTGTALLGEQTVSHDERIKSMELVVNSQSSRFAGPSLALRDTVRHPTSCTNRER